MWRHRRDLIRAYALLTVVSGIFAAFFFVVCFSWPDPHERKRAMRSVPEPCCDTVVGAPVLSGADMLPVVTATGSMERESRLPRKARERSW
jgi:hypothetical protein